MTVNENRYIVFLAEGQRYAVRIADVQMVVNAVEITTLPDVPDIVRGIINVHGEIIPVIDFRNSPDMQKDIVPDDLFILIETTTRVSAIIADGIEGILELEIPPVSTDRHLPTASEKIAGITRLKDNLIIIYNADKFLSIEGYAQLDSALTQAQ